MGIYGQGSPCPRKTDPSLWCGECYANMSGRSSYKGHSGYKGPRILQVETLAMALKKRQLETPNGDAPTKAIAGKWGKEYPILWEYLTLTTYEDGSKRVPSTLTLFADVACVKACLNDRDQGQTAWAAGETVEGTLAALERSLREDRVEWKSNGTGPGKKKR